MSWAKLAGRAVLLLLLAELVFFFVLGTRIRRQIEGPREILGGIVEDAQETGRRA
jgi:hypothetical protein